MYCVNGESGSSLLIESTNSMIIVHIRKLPLLRTSEQNNTIPIEFLDGYPCMVLVEQLDKIQVAETAYISTNTNIPIILHK